MGKKKQQYQSREQLEEYFRNGKIPSEKHYVDLINSMVHKVDDGFSKDDINGLKISSSEENKNLISFYKSLNEEHPFFLIAKDELDPDSLSLRPFQLPAEGKSENDNRFFFHTSGKLGIGKKCDPRFKTEVNGFLGMQGRIGTYQNQTSSKPADGKWPTILEKLDHCQAFEIMARTGKRGSGRFALMHALALSVYGPRGGKIKRSQTYYGFFWNKLNLRWIGTTHNYSLQLRSNSNYGEGVQIYYTITRLWDDYLFLDPED
jgi:hypothetical protein